MWHSCGRSSSAPTDSPHSARQLTCDSEQAAAHSVAEAARPNAAPAVEQKLLWSQRSQVQTSWSWTAWECLDCELRFPQSVLWAKCCKTAGWWKPITQSVSIHVPETSSSIRKLLGPLLPLLCQIWQQETQPSKSLTATKLNSARSTPFSPV